MNFNDTIPPNGVSILSGTFTVIKTRWIVAKMVGLALVLWTIDGQANETDDSSAPADVDIHGQLTLVEQYHPSFHAAYSGSNSLTPGNSGRETVDATLFFGARVWDWELYLNPEIDQGFGLSNTLGVAGFPSGEAYKVGATSPYLRLPRAFVRRVIDLGGDTESIEDKANQLAGSHTHDNLTLTVGKFSVVDIFDTNTYAHDPRADLLNWSIIEAGAFDYAADAWGYSVGAVAEWTKDRWTLRGGVFDLSTVPNAKTLQSNFHEFELVGELEERYELGERAGKVKLLAFLNRGRMASYLDALRLAAETGAVPDVTLVRRYASRPGVALNAEQEVGAQIGVFARVSANEGSKEAYEFTEINRSASGGVTIKGSSWGRDDDALSFSAVENHISSSARRYFAAGGLGILIGDGALIHERPERIGEATYVWTLAKSFSLSLDGQFVSHPAYNADRGPVAVIGARIHAEF